MSNAKSSPEQEPQSTAIVRRLDPQALLEAAIAKESAVDVIERLVALVERVRAQDAKEAWLAAMAKFQERCPAILKTKVANVRTKAGAAYRYNWAPLDELLGKAQEVMGELGLSVSFQQKIEGDKAIIACRISHEMGHSDDSGPIAIPISYDDGTAASKAQHVGIALMYGKRYSFLAISGLAPEDNPDLVASATAIPSEGQAAAPVAPTGEQSVWIGKIINVKSKTEKSRTTGKPYTLHTIQTGDAQEFESFDQHIADFAKQAGSSRVEIVWQHDKYGKKVLSIGPAEVEADARG